MPLLSILIPTRNRNSLVASNVLSICRSKFLLHNCEIIIGDNSSEFPVADTLEQFIEYPLLALIKIIRQPKNLGVHGNISSLVEHAQSPYILILGDDDFIVNKTLEEFITLSCGVQIPLPNTIHLFTFLSRSSQNTGYSINPAPSFAYMLDRPVSISVFFKTLMANDIYHEYLAFSFISNIIFPLHHFKTYSVYDRPLAMSAAPHSLTLSSYAYSENASIHFHSCPLVRCAVSLPCGMSASKCDEETHEMTRKPSVGSYNPSFDIFLNWNVMASLLLSISKNKDIGLQGTEYAMYFSNYMARTANHLILIYPRFASSSSFYSIRTFNSLLRFFGIKGIDQGKMIGDSGLFGWDILSGFDYLSGRFYEK